jgi:hypothetical protein
LGSAANSFSANCCGGILSKWQLLMFKRYFMGIKKLVRLEDYAGAVWLNFLDDLTWWSNNFLYS